MPSNIISPLMQFTLFLTVEPPPSLPKNRSLKPVTLSKYQSWRNATDRLGRRIYITVTFWTRKNATSAITVSALFMNQREELY